MAKPFPDDWEAGAQVDLGQICRAIRKHTLLLLSIAACVVALVGLHDLLATPLYTAHAKILIQTSALRVFQNSTDSSGLADSSEPPPDLNTEYELLRSRTLAVAVAKAEDLADNSLFNSNSGIRGDLLSAVRVFEGKDDRNSDSSAEVSPALVDHYLASLTISPVENTRLVDAAFTSPDAQLSARIVNAHIHQYINQGIQLESAASDQAQQFLQDKLAVLKRQVEDSEAALNRYQRDKGIVPGLISLDGKEDALLSRLDRLNDQAEAAHLKTVDLEADVDLINQGRASSLPTVLNNPSIQALQQKLNDLDAHHASLAEVYRPDYPELARLNAEIDSTRNDLKQAVENILASTKVEYVEAASDEQNLDRELATQKAYALELDDDAVKYNILAREAETNHQLYQAVLKRMKDVEVTQDLHASRVSIVDLATPPLAASSPKTFRDLTAALLVGLLGGIVAALFLEQQDQSLKNAEEVEAFLQVPTLSVIPIFHRNTDSGYRGLEKPRTELPALPTEYGYELAVSYNTSSATGEAYRILRTALLLSRAGAPPKTILVTSALPEEGKTSTATNLAVALAKTGRKVLLIDGDLRRPSCHKMLAVANHLGLTEVLTGICPLDGLINNTAIENLYLLSSGKIPPNPSELLGSSKMLELLAELQERFDFLVIDSPPIIPVTDAILLATKVDGVIVIAAKQSHRGQVKLAMSRLVQVNAHIFGVVLNKTEWASGPYYRYYF
ncbi:MAG TPA: polysaccharide biosynthesis tyrosine autokinase [Candidatus Binataceae bacterium]|nr:polysaccharide biosynthesis tyrosine autokinase [Candidatus Binataceae bacterium]